MGGGGAMRTAAKVAGIGVANAGIRGGISSVPPPVEQSVRSASMPVSAIISSSQVCVGEVAAPAVQRPVWELDDWEFAGGVEEEQTLVEPCEPMPRLVFGGAPSLQEAKEATTELKDALHKVYLSSPTYDGSSGSVGLGKLAGLTSITNSDDLETKSCVTCKPAPVPTYAIKAFELLNKSTAAQSVVASIASDPNVWDAVLKNESLQEFLQFQKTDAEVQHMGSPRKFTDVSDDESQDGTFKTETTSDDESKDGKFKTETTDILNNIKRTVVEMVSNVSAYIQNIFGFLSSENTSASADENAKPTFIDKTLGASFMALTVMAIMVVVLKRG